MKDTRTDPLRDIVVVVGLGNTGLSVVRHLRARGETVEVMDSREAPPGLAELREAYPEVPVTLGGFDARRLARAGRVLLSPGVSLAEPEVAAAVAAGVEVIGDVELFAREAAAPVIAITGSNGKSTVTALLGDMVRAANIDVRVGGNLTPPALDLLRNGTPELFVLELSSFQLETTWSLAPRVAALLNVSPDHLDRYTDFAAYVEAKSRIFSGAEVAVLNLDDECVRALRPQVPRILGFSIEGDRDAVARLERHEGEDWLVLDAQPLMPARETSLAGRHNLANSLAALAIGHAAGLSRRAMVDALTRFAGLAHRCMPVAEDSGVRWIDDSKGTNVGAAVAAINGLGEGCNLVLVAGGLGKGQDFTPLAGPIGDHVHTLVLMGRDADAIDAIAPPQVRREHARDMDEAVSLAAAAARSGDTVLLSPACASFDLFDSYVARGEAFQRAVRARVQA